jgi:hypothetical protein
MGGVIVMPNEVETIFRQIFIEELLPDTDLLERYCAENERDDAHMPGRERKQ